MIKSVNLSFENGNNCLKCFNVVAVEIPAYVQYLSGHTSAPEPKPYKEGGVSRTNAPYFADWKAKQDYT